MMPGATVMPPAINDNRAAPYRILIADDEPNIVLSLEFLMQRQGYQTAAARNGEEALRLAAEFAPDLVLLDIMLPAVNGFEVCRRLRADPALRAMRVLMLTARGRESEVKRGLAEGADGYLTKPFATLDLLEAVRNLLQTL